MAYTIIRQGRVVAVVYTRVAARLIAKKGSKIVKTPAPCPVCHSRSGHCVAGSVRFVPDQMWQRRSSRRPRNK